MAVTTVAIDNPIAVYPEVGRTGSLGLGTATATATHAETDEALYVQVPYYLGRMIRLGAKLKRMESQTLRKTATRDPTSWAMSWFFGLARRR